MDVYEDVWNNVVRDVPLLNITDPVLGGIRKDVGGLAAMRIQKKVHNAVYLPVNSIAIAHVAVAVLG
ncbi:MAG: hypothetical protein LBT97_03145 [Planctomycetota bacterium]|jgi:hypothetical protein|nr:hypothetical protein [Planctomycetota bacterium]